MKLISLIILIFILESCKPSLYEINNVVCKNAEDKNIQNLCRKHYFVSGEKNTFKYSKTFFWKIDSIQNGKIIQDKNQIVEIIKKDSIFPSTIYYRSKILKRKHYEIIQCGSKPSLKLQMYQGIRNDSIIDFNNFIFFRLFFVSSANSPEKIKIPIQKYFYSYNDSNYNNEGYFSPQELLRMKNLNVKKIIIDSIMYYDYEGIIKHQAINKKLYIDYEKLAEYDDLWQSRHNSMGYDIDRKRKKVGYNGYHNRYIVFCLNSGICNINISFENGRNFASLQINSEYQKCEDFVKFEPNEVYTVDVKGSYNYICKLRYVIIDNNVKK